MQLATVSAMPAFPARVGFNAVRVVCNALQVAVLSAAAPALFYNLKNIYC